MNTLRTEGIILRTVNFKDYDQILTVFTEQEGMASFIYKGANNLKKNKGNVTSPLTRAEFIYTKGKGNLFTCRELSLLNQHLPLRENLLFLEIACELVLSLQTSQLFGKPAPALYKLLTAYLEKIPCAKNPKTLSASFRLKLLRHEGLYGFSPHCAACQVPLTTFYVTHGETFCKIHAPPSAIIFNEEEAHLITLLAFSLSLKQLAETTLTPILEDKIKQFFDEQLAS